MDELDMAALIYADLEAEYAAALDGAHRAILGDLDQWRPTGLLAALGDEAPVQCGEPIRYWNPFGGHGQIPCDLASQHDGAHDSSQLMMRPEDTISLAIFPESE